jgi:PAS domain S-box-containing protein
MLLIHAFTLNRSQVFPRSWPRVCISLAVRIADIPLENAVVITTVTDPSIGVCLTLTRAISRTRTVEEIYTIALDALALGLDVSRSSIQLFDTDGVMRFKAWRGLSDRYRASVEGQTPWTHDTPDPDSLLVPDVAHEPSLAAFLPALRDEGIAAVAFVPLVSLGSVIGKFMLYYDAPYTLSPDEVQLAGVIASQVAFALERTRAEEQSRLSEERLHFALDAASMGTWEWDLINQRVRWSDNLEGIHGLPTGSFRGTFSSYAREIHPEDRVRVQASIQRALDEGVAHDVEYRVVAPDGTISWVEGKGRVEFEQGKPARMTGVCMIVTRRKEAELARLAAAEETSRLKDEFLATLSHELRTPLNAILGWVQMLQSGTLSSERMKQAIEVIRRNTILQAQLIEDILDVSRIITGKLEVERVPVWLPELITTVVSGALPSADAKGVEIVPNVASDLPSIHGDPKRLHQVIGNVLSNAVKFTPHGGRVEVMCALEGESVVIDVRDSGVGIAPEFLPYVFDRFRQADSRSTRRHGGLGLGLAIARHLVKLHDGEIEARSDGTGRGTTVRVRLPLPAGTQASGRPLPSPSTSLPEPELRLPGVTVLVVDDQPDARELLAALFERCGARVAQCSNAVAAIETLMAQPIDLLVADIAMPDIDGCELIRRVRDSHPELPAIAVSAYARPQDRRRALAAGYHGYCAKPLEAAQLLQAVGEMLVAS